MYYKKFECLHQNKIIDFHNGDEICTDCGIILGAYFIEEQNNLDSENYNKNDEKYNIILELLNRLEVSKKYCIEIYNFLNSEIINKITKDYLKEICYSIYIILNKNNIPISIKEISNVSGISCNKIFSCQKFSVHIELSLDELLDKYVSILKLPYKAYSVIKKTLPFIPISGHNPNTIIASSIYKYCKLNAIKLSMKKIAEAFNISSVSIQRYLKENKE